MHHMTMIDNIMKIIMMLMVMVIIIARIIIITISTILIIIPIITSPASSSDGGGSLTCGCQICMISTCKLVTNTQQRRTSHVHHKIGNGSKKRQIERAEEEADEEKQYVKQNE